MSIQFLGQTQNLSRKHWKIHGDPKLQKLKRTRVTRYILFCSILSKSRKIDLYKDDNKKTPTALGLSNLRSIKWGAYSETIALKEEQMKHLQN